MSAVGYKFEQICDLGAGHALHGYEILSRDQRILWTERDKQTLLLLPSLKAHVAGNISVNLSTESILTLPNKVIESAALEIPGLIIEWVETRASDAKMVTAANLMKGWREQFGVRISLDDMGKGQDCFERFLMIKPDFAKLDGSILHGARNNKSHRNALKTLCGWCESEDVPTIIEWIESDIDLDIALNAGGIYGQGYYFEGLQNTRKRKMSM